MTTPSPAPPAEPASPVSERLGRFLAEHGDEPGDKPVMLYRIDTGPELSIGDLRTLARQVQDVRALLIEVNADPDSEPQTLHLLDNVADALGIARCEVCGTLEGVHTEDECYQ